jgi:chromosome segregation ATPase
MPNSSLHHKDEITRISDSMPGTADVDRGRLVGKLEQEHSDLLHQVREFREKEVMWDKQQTEHEMRAQDYRKLFREKAEVDRAHESMTRNRDKLRAQVETQAAEIKTLRDELEAQRRLGLESADEKDVEITRLRKEVETANLERDKALKSVESTDETMEYTKEQYRTASQRAGQLQSDYAALEAQKAKLEQQASGEVAKLKQMHIDKSTKNALAQNKALLSQVNHLNVQLRQKEEELIRAKSNAGRMGYGTRAQSTTPQPKTRSRAASPIMRNRVGNLRHEER